MAVTKAARKGGMVAHILRDDVNSLCGRAMAFVPGGEGKRLCKTCARIKGMVVTTEEITFTESEWEFIRTPRDAFFMSMIHDVLNDYAETGDNDPRRIAVYNAIVEHHTMAATEIVVTNAPGGNRGGGDGMVNRNSKSVAKGILTDNQRASLIRMSRFMDSLIGQLMELQGKEVPADWNLGADLTEEWFAKLKTRADINKSFDSFSSGIDKLKTDIAKLRSEARKVESKTEKTNAIEDGYYVYGDTFACVKFNRAGTRQYATVWDNECQSWEYDSRESAKVKSGILSGDIKRVTPEDAKRFGDLYGSCMKCSRTLTKPESIAAGIGPVCAGGMGW